MEYGTNSPTEAYIAPNTTSLTCTLWTQNIAFILTIGSIAKKQNTTTINKAKYSPSCYTSTVNKY